MELRLTTHWPLLAGGLVVMLAACSPLQPAQGMRLISLLLLMIGGLWFSRSNLQGWVSYWPAWLPWLVWSGLSLSWSFEPDYSVHYWLSEILPAVMLIGLGVQLARQGLRELWLFGALGLMVVLQAIVSMAHIVWPLAVPLYYPGWLSDEPQATAYLVLGFPAAVWFLLGKGRCSWTAAALILLAIQIVAWVALKRSPYFAMLAQSSMFLLLMPFLHLPPAVKRRLSIALSLFFLCSLFVAIHVGNSRPASYAPGAIPETGLVAAVAHNERYQTWAFWLEQGKSNFWGGTGVGMWLPNHVYVQGKIQDADSWLFAHGHNVFLDQWLQLGLPGLLAFSWLWLLLFRHSQQGMADANCQYVRILSALAFATLLAMVIRSGTDDILYGSYAALWWLTVGYIGGRTEAGGDKAESRQGAAKLARSLR